MRSITPPMSPPEVTTPHDSIVPMSVDAESAARYNDQQCPHVPGEREDAPKIHVLFAFGKYSADSNGNKTSHRGNRNFR